MKSGRDSRFKQAITYIELGRYKEAEVLLGQFIAENPEDGFARAHLALCLLRQKDFKNALKESKRAVVATPDKAYCHYVLAWVLAGQGKCKMAKAPAEEALRLDPGDPNNHVLMGVLLEATGFRAASLKEAEIALELDPNTTEAHELRARLFQKLGKLAEADQSVQSVLALRPDQSSAHTLKGWSLLRENKPDEAVASFMEALRLNPNSEKARTGALEALRARYLFYRLVLNFTFALDKFPDGGKVVTAILTFSIFRLYGFADENHWAVAPYILPFSILAGFLWFTRIAGKFVTDGLLMLNPRSRKVLNKTERGFVTIFWSSLLMTLIMVAVASLFHNLAWIVAIVFGLTTIFTFLLSLVRWKVQWLYIIGGIVLVFGGLTALAVLTTSGR